MASTGTTLRRVSSRGSVCLSRRPVRVHSCSPRERWACHQVALGVASGLRLGRSARDLGGLGMKRRAPSRHQGVACICSATDCVLVRVLVRAVREAAGREGRETRHDERARIENSLRLPATLDDLRGLRSARWVRESTRGQYDTFGPEAQREQQDRAVERYGLIESGLSWSVAHSGRTVANTGQFRDMLSRAGIEYDLLVVGYVSRFARDLRTAVNARHDLHAAGAAILFCDERVLTSDEDGWELFAREAVEAEAYSRRLGKRIREGYAAKFRRFADQAGNPGWGFRRVAGRLEPDPLKSVASSVRSSALRPGTSRQPNWPRSSASASNRSARRSAIRSTTGGHNVTGAMSVWPRHGALIRRWATNSGREFRTFVAYAHAAGVRRANGGGALIR